MSCTSKKASRHGENKEVECSNSVNGVVEPVDSNSMRPGWKELCREESRAVDMIGSPFTVPSFTTVSRPPLPPQFDDGCPGVKPDGRKQQSSSHTRRLMEATSSNGREHLCSEWCVDEWCVV